MTIRPLAENPNLDEVKRQNPGVPADLEQRPSGALERDSIGMQDDNLSPNGVVVDTGVTGTQYDIMHPAKKRSI
jgi:hypothetical protein